MPQPSDESYGPNYYLFGDEEGYVNFRWEDGVLLAEIALLKSRSITIELGTSTDKKAELECLQAENGQIVSNSGTAGPNGDWCYTVTATAASGSQYDGYTLTTKSGDAVTRSISDCIADGTCTFKDGSAVYTVTIPEDSTIQCHFKRMALDFDHVELFEKGGDNWLSTSKATRSSKAIYGKNRTPVLTLPAGGPGYIDISAPLYGRYDLPTSFSTPAVIITATAKEASGNEWNWSKKCTVSGYQGSNSSTANCFYWSPGMDTSNANALMRLHVGLAIDELPDAREMTVELKFSSENYISPEYKTETFTIPLASQSDSTVNDLRTYYENLRKDTGPTFLYYLDWVYDQESKKVFGADETTKETAYTDAVAALDGATYGAGADAAVWQFIAQDGVSNEPILLALPPAYGERVTNAEKAMGVALDTRYKEWIVMASTGGGWGAFVNYIKAGPNNGGGFVYDRESRGGHNYGFWYYNDTYAQVGVTGWAVQDGDVMAWNPMGKQTKLWNQAVMNFYYGYGGWSDATLGTYNIADDLTKAQIPVPTGKKFYNKDGSEQTYVDFTRYGRWREFGAFENVMRLIREIGSVTPTDECKKRIDEARSAYDALSTNDRNSVKNYDDLTAAEAAYADLTAAEPNLEVTFEQGRDNTLASLQKITSPSVSSVKGEWAVLALARYGITDWTGFAAYRNSLDQILAKGDEHGSGLDPNKDSPTEYARVALALTAMGYDASAYQANNTTYDLTYNLQMVDKLKAQGINAVAYALIALDAMPYAQTTDGQTVRTSCLNYLVENQCSGGGWSYSGKDAAADPDMTAMVLQALAPYYQKSSSPVNINSAVESALSQLASLHQTAGGFLSMGEYNSESCAQVIVALCALGIDPTTWDIDGKRDVLTALLKFYDSTDTTNGAGFKHSPSSGRDQMATEQAAYALVAYNRFRNGSTSLYDMSDIAQSAKERNEAALETVVEAVEAALAGWEASLPDSTTLTTQSLGAWLADKLAVVQWGGATHTEKVNAVDPTVNGTADAPEGKAGSVTFTVEVTYGSGSTAAVWNKEYTAELPAKKYQSSNTGVQSVTVCDVEGTINGTAVSVTLPAGTEITADNIKIVPADKATVSGPAQNEDKIWSFTVTAENGTDSAEYTITISYTPTGPTREENQAAVDAAKAVVENAFGGWNDLPGEINRTTVEQWAKAKLDSLGLGNVSYTVPDINISPAVDGNPGNPSGTAGNVAFTVTLTAGSDSTLATENVFFTKTLPAQPYESGDTGLLTVTVLGTPGTISGTNVCVTLPAGTDITGINESSFGVTLSDPTSSYAVTASGSSWSIVVTAQNGSTATYTVTLTVEQEPVKPVDPENVEAAEAVLKEQDGQNIPVGIVTADNAADDLAAKAAIANWLERLLTNFTLNRTIEITGYTAPQPGVAGSYSADVTFTIQKTTTPAEDSPANAPSDTTTPGGMDASGGTDGPSGPVVSVGPGTPNEPDTSDESQTPSNPETPPVIQDGNGTSTPDDDNPFDDAPDGEKEPADPPAEEDTSEQESEARVLSADYDMDDLPEGTTTVTVHINGTIPALPVVLSSNTGVSSVTYQGTALTRSGSTFTLQLASGMTAPASGDAFKVDCEDIRATAGTPVSSGDNTWTFTVTAEDKSTTSYTIIVKEAPVEPPTPSGSSDASVASVSWGSVTLDKSGYTFTLTLESGMTAPSSGSDFTITCTDRNAVYSPPEKTSTGWSFTVTAEDGETTATYTIRVTTAPSGPTLAENTDAVQAAVNKINGITSWDVDMAAANDTATLATFVKTKLAGVGLNGVTADVRVTCNPAVAGTGSNPSGTAGSYTAEITLSKGSGASAYSMTLPGVTGKISPAAYIPPETGTITVYFTLLGDDAHGDPGTANTHTLSGGGLQTWIPEQRVEVTTNSSVGDVFKKVMDAEGYSYVGLENNYIKSITTPDKRITLAEKQNGKLSGWMYTVGGTHPNVGLNSRKLKDGEHIVWHYTDDYTKEEGRFEPVDPVNPPKPSGNTNVRSVSYNGTALVQSGTAFTLQLTDGMAAPTSGRNFTIVCADSKAKASVPVETASGWSFTVTAENGTVASYTITVKAAVGPGPVQTVDSNTKDEADKNVAGGENNKPIQSLKPVSPVVDAATEAVKIEDAAQVTTGSDTVTAEVKTGKVEEAVRDVTTGEGKNSAVIVIDASDNSVKTGDHNQISNVEVTLPAAAVEALDNAVQDTRNPVEKVALVTNAGTVTLAGEALRTVRTDAGVQREDGVKLRITNLFTAEPDAAEKYEKDNISHLFDVKLVTKSTGAEVKVSGLKQPITITFQIGTYLNTKDFIPKIIYVGAGKNEVLPNNYYNPETGVISAETTHLSNFAVTARAAASTPPDTTLYEDALKSVLDYIGGKVTNPTVNSTSGEWAVLALARAGVLNENTKQMYLANLADYAKKCGGRLDMTPGQYSHTEYSRVILALTSVGLDASNFRGYDFVTPLFDNSCQQVSEQGNNGTIWALIALNSGNYRKDTTGDQARAAWINRLAREQLQSGGWSISDVDRTADLDTTAMAVQALAPYYTGKRSLPTGVSMAIVRQMVERGVSFLSSQQNAGGGFGSSEADAQVVVMLSALNRDAAADTAFTKNGNSVLTDLLSYRDAATGGFCHEQDSAVDQMATEQAAYALVAYDRYQKGAAHTLYDMTDAFSAAPIVTGKHTITATYNTGGKITPYGKVEVKDGGTSAFTFQSDIGYELYELLVDNQRTDYVYIDNQRTYLDETSHVTHGKYVFENVTSNHEIRAIFKRSAVTTVPDYGPVIGKVSISIENRTYSGGDFYGTLVNGTYDLCQRDTMMTSVLKALAQNGYTWEGTGGTSADSYDITYISHIKQGVKDLGEFSGGRGSGWMGTLNDWFTNEGFQAFRVGGSGTYALENGDEIHVVYTTNLGTDVGGGRGNPDTSLRSLSINGGTLSPNFTSGTVEYTLTVPDQGASVRVTSSAANKNFLVKTFLNHYNSDSAYYKRGRTVSVKPGDTIYIGVGDKSWPSMYDAGSYTGTIYTIRVTGTGLQSRISALPKAAEITYETFRGIVKLVEQLRADYERLSAAEKAKLNITRLTEAEARIKYFNVVDDVKRRLGAIPSVIGMTEAQAEDLLAQVRAAYAAYDALEDDQKACITLEDAARHNAAVEWLEKLGYKTDGPILMDRKDDNGTSVSIAPLPFTDVTNHWAMDGIRFTYERGLMKGVSTAAFDPEGEMSRSMFVTVLYRMENEPAAPAATYSDVPADAWYTAAVGWASANNIVNGTGNNRYSPDDSITRDEMATMMLRYAKFKGYDVTATADLSGYLDSAQIPEWAYRAMEWASSTGLITGRTVNILAPQGTATRAETTAILMRFLQRFAPIA